MRVRNEITGLPKLLGKVGHCLGDRIYKKAALSAIRMGELTILDANTDAAPELLLSFMITGQTIEEDFNCRV